MDRKIKKKCSGLSIDFKNMNLVKPFTKHEMTIFKATVSPPMFVSNYISWGRSAWRLARDTTHGVSSAAQAASILHSTAKYLKIQNIQAKTHRVCITNTNQLMWFSEDVCCLDTNTPCVFSAISGSWSVWCWCKDIHFLRNAQLTAGCRTSLFP